MKKFLLITLIFILAACSSAPKLDLGGEWQLVSYGDKTNLTPALPNIETSFKFENGQLSGNAGCNGFGGSYELQGNSITFSGIMSTMMFCEETSNQEQGVLSILADNVALQIQVNGNMLTIASADGLSVLNLEHK